METGADMAECDVRRTADGSVVLMHDAALKRTTGGAPSRGTVNAPSNARADACQPRS